MPDLGSYLIAAYVLTALVLLGYGAALLRRVARAERRARSLDGRSEPAGVDVAIPAASAGGARAGTRASAEVSRG